MLNLKNLLLKYVFYLELKKQNLYKLIWFVVLFFGIKKLKGCLVLLYILSKYIYKMVENGNLVLLYFWMINNECESYVYGSFYNDSVWFFWCNVVDLWFGCWWVYGSWWCVWCFIFGFWNF